MTSVQLAPAILIPLVLWRIYVRVRRNTTRRQLHPIRLRIWVALCTLIAALVTFVAAARLPSLEAELAGLAVGGLLALLGLKLTRWEMTPEGSFYTPNAFLGIGLTLLFLGRVIYVFTALFAGSAVAANGEQRVWHCPVTLALFGLTAGYYIAYATGVLVRGRHVA